MAASSFSALCLEPRWSAAAGEMRGFFAALRMTSKSKSKSKSKGNGNGNDKGNGNGNGNDGDSGLRPE
jgi:hypothetical protein